MSNLGFIPMGFRSALDPYQLKAATCSLGPKRCNAAAGSGKTTTYAHRVVFLKANGVKEENIMATTFTKKAANEMRERIEKVARKNDIDINTKEMWIGTFHSLGIQAIRLFCHVVGYNERFTIIDDDDQEAIFKKLIAESNSFKGIKLKVGDLISATSFARNSGQDYYEVFTKRLWNVSNHLACVEIAEQYEKTKRSMNVLDFDDMLIYWLQILQQSATARNFFQERFHHVLVDEYQDTNYIQNEIIDIIAAGHRNLFVVGDDYQSIYAFRAAEVNNIISFDSPSRYPDAESFVLANNYRCTPEIVELAQASITQNTVQLHKEVKAPGKNGSKPILFRPNDEIAQAKKIVGMIKKLHGDYSVPYKEMAVLYRNNNMTLLLEQELNKNLIPYVKKGAQFWKKAHIKLALSWIKVAQNPMDKANMVRCAEMFDGVGRAAIQKLLDAIQTEDDFHDFIGGNLVPDPKKPALYDGLRSHLHEIENIISEDDNPVKSGVGYIVNFLIPYCQTNWKGEEGADRAEDLTVLIDLAEQFESVQELLEAIALQEERSNKKKDRDELTLSTGHGAKGLEWGVVFMISLVSEMFPSKFVKTREELEEERRLFYVMLTRAKQKLYMFAPCMVKKYGEEVWVDPSMFLEELPPELMDIKNS